MKLGAPPAPGAALVFFAGHEKARVQRLTAPFPQVAVYRVDRAGAVETIRGKPVASVGAIPAGHVAWIGVPQSWVDSQLGTRQVRSHWPARASRKKFSVVPEGAAQKCMTAAVEAAASAEKAANEAAAKAARARKPFSEPPVFVPKGLR